MQDTLMMMKLGFPPLHAGQCEMIVADCLLSAGPWPRSVIGAAVFQLHVLCFLFPAAVCHVEQPNPGKTPSLGDIYTQCLVDTLYLEGLKGGVTLA